MLVEHVTFPANSNKNPVVKMASFHFCAFGRVADGKVLISLRKKQRNAETRSELFYDEKVFFKFVVLQLIRHS